LPLEQVGALVLVYNLLAFALQPVAGLLVDRLQRPHAAAILGLLLNAAALAVAALEPRSAVLLAGAGSAFFHVGGGALALTVTPGRAAGVGVFAAPGVIGLALGGMLAASGSARFWPVIALLLALAFLLAGLLLSSHAAAPTATRTTAHTHEPLFDRHDWIMMILLVAIALRSAVWTAFQIVYEGNAYLLLWLAFAAAGGKVVGGFLADRIGWRRWSLAALLAAAALLSLGEHLFTLCAGVALLQSATPAMIAAAARLLPRAPATAAGLTLGLAIAAGGVPALAGWSPQLHAPPLLALFLASSAFLFWRTHQRAPAPPLPAAP
jgi:FSR family fosmidomycin resistance protein-like MFS transporter